MVFLPAGPDRHPANPPGRLLFKTGLSGVLAVAYVVVVRLWRPWIPVLVAFHIQVFVLCDRVAAPTGPPTAIIFGFISFSHLIRREGVRGVRGHASDIHRQFVPRIERRIGKFELCGVSAASGEAGGLAARRSDAAAGPRTRQGALREWE